MQCELLAWELAKLWITWSNNQMDVTMLASQKKDLYNNANVNRRVQIRNGDAEGALACLCGKSEMDPSFYYKYNVDEDNRLPNLFWVDSTSKLDYTCF